MRVAVVVAVVLLGGCATDRLGVNPPRGVDFSGLWRLNAEESDDPRHLIDSPDPSRATAASQGQGGGGQGGQGGRRGRQGGPAGGGGFGGVTTPPPSAPVIAALSEGLRWPGKEVEIKQVAGVVAMTSGGVNQVYQPTTGDKKTHHHHKPDDDGPGARDRDMPSRDRDGPPARCGWDDKTLVVEGGEADDDHPPFEERYSVSEDGQRLIEVVGFKSGRAAGFTLSRVWDRVDRSATDRR